MNKTISVKQDNSFHSMCLLIFIFLLPVLTHAQPEKPKVAILVYEGVQIIDHALPFEVFGQFSLNEVYTVAKDPGPLSTYMGMKILPSYSFEDAPVPDVLVLPGGNAGSAVSDPKIKEWINQAVASAEHVLTICTGIFFLEENEILKGKRITTWYDRQKELQLSVPGSEVVGEEVTVESGKLISAAGLGIEGSLRVLSKLHGTAWAEVVRLNMEYEPIPDSLRVPRIELADLKLPDQIYAAFPWRQAELLQYEGNQKEWMMAWRYMQTAPLDTLRIGFLEALDQEPNWTLDREHLNGSGWRSYWDIQHVHEENWQGEIRLNLQNDQVEIHFRVSEL